MPLPLEQLLIGALAAFIIGFSKTGVPGLGILAIPVIAALFPGRASLGATLPLLLAGDVLALLLYRRNAHWPTLARLAPSVLIGFGVGITAFLVLNSQPSARDQIGVIIGWMVLLMVGLHLLRLRFPDLLAPHTALGTHLAGTLAGFATLISNAAGPIMQIYMSGLRLEKRAFMGSSAWFYFIFNALKIPIYLALTALAPDQPFFTAAGLTFCLALVPVVGIGGAAGRWALGRLPQRAFTLIVLVLSAAAALKLILGI
ncbi:MAG: sulfite exporter TauE/SafE family protein [Thermoflexales bacterium]|nr:sulfite exporter TauE/SafE family protein [Thermoflexales bacterium]